VCNFCLFCKVLQKHGLDEVKNKPSFDWLIGLYLVNTYAKNYSNKKMFAQVTAKNVGGVF